MPKYSVYILCNPSTPFNQATQNQIIGAKKVAVLSGDKLQTEPQPWIDRNLYLFLLFTVLAKHKEAALSTESHTFTVKFVPILAIIARLTLEQTFARSKRKSDSCVCVQCFNRTLDVYLPVWSQNTKTAKHNWNTIVLKANCTNEFF